MYEDPVIVSGKTDEQFTLTAVNGKLYIDGEGKFKVSRGDYTSEYELTGANPKPIDLSALQYHFP
jgi:hypothetical protein